MVSYKRIAALHERYGERFAQRVLSQHELKEYSGHAHPARLLTKRFAAKEALAKATGSGLRYPVTMQRISVTHNDLGKPEFLFDAVLAEHLRHAGVTHHHLSISDDHDMAVAFVVLEK